MAIDSELISVKPTSFIFASSSSTTDSSLSPSDRRKRYVQVAAINSAAFIQFPINVRQQSAYVPVFRSRTSHSSTRIPSCPTDSQLFSNHSKFSETTPSSSNDSSTEHKRAHSQQRTNPILNNPLLNHRREPPKSSMNKQINEYSRLSKLCLSTKPFESISDENHLSNIHSSITPILDHQKENPYINISDRLMISAENKNVEQRMQYVDANKYDYITRWLNEVRAATFADQTVLPKAKRTKKRSSPS